MWVVKIGGSLETDPGLSGLLSVLVDYGGSKIIIVPGGGRFADRVRAEQRVTGMDDATAHRLAVRGMEEYAAVLCGMDARLYPVADIGGIRSGGATSLVPVWLPAELLAGQPGIPANWQVTSDSLALWFAGRIGAEAVILVKSASKRTNNAQELAAAGYLDEYFPVMMKKTAPGIIACACIDEPEILKQALATGLIPPEIRIL